MMLFFARHFFKNQSSFQHAYFWNEDSDTQFLFLTQVTHYLTAVKIRKNLSTGKMCRAKVLNVAVYVLFWLLWFIDKPHYKQSAIRLKGSGTIKKEPSWTNICSFTDRWKKNAIASSNFKISNRKLDTHHFHFLPKDLNSFCKASANI